MMIEHCFTIDIDKVFDDDDDEIPYLYETSIIVVTKFQTRAFIMSPCLCDVDLYVVSF